MLRLKPIEAMKATPHGQEGENRLQQGDRMSGQVKLLNMAYPSPLFKLDFSSKKLFRDRSLASVRGRLVVMICPPTRAKGMVRHSA